MKYVGSGVILGKPVLTTYKRIRVWQVPVYTRDHKFLNNIYIDNNKQVEKWIKCNKWGMK